MTTKLSENQHRGTNFRWIVPQLSTELWSKKQQFKYNILDKLKNSKTASKGLKYYVISIESHADGNPHLDMLLIFHKQIRMSPTELDFLCDKHGDLTRYRTLNQAILQYGFKQDKPLSTLPDTDTILNQHQVKKDPITFLMKQVDKDPFNFDFLKYCLDNNYFATIQRWTYVKHKIRDYQEAKCNSLLQNKPGIRKIDTTLIQQELSSSEQQEYYSWDGYQKIVDFINQIPTYGSQRPSHTQNLFLCGKPRTGKTSLIEAIEEHTAVYPVGTQNWFPKFKNHIYRLFFWDQCRLSMMPYQQLLILLDGRPYDLPYKGGSTLKYDNQLWILTSNIPVIDHLQKRHVNQDFNNPIKPNVIEESFRKRVKEITIPDNKDLFILIKLIKSNYA